MTNSTINDLSNKYSLANRITHWLTALGIFTLIPLGLIMHEMEVSADKLSLFRTHTIIGIVILLLTLFRVYLYFAHDCPPQIKTGSNFTDKLVGWVHNAFYFTLLLITFAGLAINISLDLINIYRSNDVSQFPVDIEVLSAEVHETLYIILAILIVMHVAGVLKHIIFKKENIIKRMF
ncbi:MAG: hypothetical protein GWP19_13490 [Planctomycetia bacterium]|nr:hypothetical protein [Planctomycetia bacterium]